MALRSSPSGALLSYMLKAELMSYNAPVAEIQATEVAESSRLQMREDAER